VTSRRGTFTGRADVIRDLKGAMTEDYHGTLFTSNIVITVDGAEVYSAQIGGPKDHEVQARDMNEAKALIDARIWSDAGSLVASMSSFRHVARDTP